MAFNNIANSLTARYMQKMRIIYLRNIFSGVTILIENFGNA